MTSELPEPAFLPSAPPLSLGLRDFGSRRWLTALCSFGEPAPNPKRNADGYFPACISSSRSFCLSVSGAVAPSAPDRIRSLPRESGGRWVKGRGESTREFGGIGTTDADQKALGRPACLSTSFAVCRLLERGTMKIRPLMDERHFS